MKYRTEIDGLRALAVVPVILFHAGFELFSGGFVGVDVFFVISGYLITTILIEDIENKNFSVINFYERRARRILPALFFVMLMCIPFAWMWMLPSQMKDFSQSLVAVSLFASNILFWNESGYFDAAAEEKPLLHTWSLAVEEQYYVLFPIFLILAWRFGKNRVFWMIVVMATISLLLSEWGWRNKATANFYLAPTRAWELFVGSIVAFILQNRDVQKNNLLALVGLTAIVFSIFYYDETTPFPSVYALVPVLGVALLMLYAEKDTFVGKVLSTRGFVRIGLISYSAYLWHQPLFAFARIRSLDDPSFLLMSVLSVTSLVLAYFSWRYIEKPFRNRTSFTKGRVTVISILGLSIFILTGFTGHISEGFMNKDVDIDRYEQLRTLRLSYSCVETHPTNVITECVDYYDRVGLKVLIIGDSYSHSLRKILKEDDRFSNLQSISYAGNKQCLKIWSNREELQNYDGEFCSTYFTNLAKNVVDEEIDLIIFWRRWHVPENNQREYSTQEAFKEFLQRLSIFSERTKVVLLGPLPTYPFDMFSWVRRGNNNVSDEYSYSYEKFRDEMRWFYKEVDKLKSDLIFFDLARDICREGGVCEVADTQTLEPLYIDSNHLSIKFGEKYIVPKLNRLFTEFIEEE